MSALGTALNTEEGRKAFETYAEDSVRMRIRKRWEKRREETAHPPALYLGSQPVQNLGDHYFTAAWRNRWPNEDGWTPYSVRQLRVLQ